MNARERGMHARLLSFKQAVFKQKALIESTQTDDENELHVSDPCWAFINKRDAFSAM